jgi:hypothetical protein
MLQSNWDLAVGCYGNVESEVRGIGRGRRRVLRRSHQLRVVPRMLGMLDHYISALVPSGVRGVLLKSKLP